MDNKLVNLEIKVLEIKKPEIFFPEVRLNKDIKKRISLLPKEIQKKIYIYCFRFFWRDYVPLIAKVPSWYERKIKIDKELYEARNKNIHFLHLSFNCLPENKSWIMGCQCEYCFNFGLNFF